MTVLKKVAERITKIRHDKKFSQEKLAEFAGLHKNYIGAIERAEKNPSILVLYKIANALNISLSDLLKDI